MQPMYIKQKRIRKLVLPKRFDANKIQIGIPVKKNENETLSLKTIGDVVIPSPDFGANCDRNANGYTYPDKNAPKKRRRVSTIWMHPFGNENASEIPVDIYKKCYPKIFVEPTEIELGYLQKNTQKFIIAILDKEKRENYLKETVNLFLEIFGYCYIFADELTDVNNIEYTRCNWEILPPGTKPSVYLKKHSKNNNEKVNGFSLDRLTTIEKYNPIQAVQGTNGFSGYFAFLFNDFCILESAKYGNATYIIPSKNWEELSQKTKKELFDKNYVLQKIIHTSDWKTEIENVF